MNYRALRRLLPLSLVAFAAVLLASAQSANAPDYKTLVGTWKMTSDTNGGDPVEWTLVLKDQDGKLAGFLTLDQGTQPAKEFSYSGGVIRFKAPYEGEEYDIELKATGDKLDGTWSGGGSSGRTSGTKS